MQLSMDHQKRKKQTDSLNATENLLFSEHFRNEFLKTPTLLFTALKKEVLCH